jgi:hypothetical protein
MLSESQQKLDIPLFTTDSRTVLEPGCTLSNRSGVHFFQIMAISGKASSIRSLIAEVKNEWRLTPAPTSL